MGVCPYLDRGGRGALALAGVFAGEGARATRIWFNQLSEHGAARLKVVFETEHRHRDTLGFRAGQTHHTNPTAPGRSGDGHDGVIKVHRKILARRCAMNRSG